MKFLLCRAAITLFIVALGTSSAANAAFTWTDLQPSVDSRQIYVSRSDGTDQNDCLSAATACTLSRGIGMLRNGYPDWLLIKRGDIFNEPLSKSWGLSGRSATEPMVITTYGEAAARPAFHSGAEVGFHNNLQMPLRYLRIVGISFLAHTRNPNSPDYTGYAGTYGVNLMALSQPIEDILIEGCEVGYYIINVRSHSLNSVPLGNIRLRANYIHDAWSNYQGEVNQGFSQGIYTDGIDGLLLEQNVVDHNGGLYNYPGDSRFTVPPAGMTMSNITLNFFNHQFYGNVTNKNVRLLNNVFAGGDGVQVRSGGVVEDNIFVRIVVAITGGTDSGLVVPEAGVGGYDFDIKRNLFMEGTDFPPEGSTPGPRGFGISLTNTSATGANIEDNLFLRDQSAAPYGLAIQLIGRTCNQATTPIPCSIRRAVVKNNFMHDWRGGILANGVPGIDLLDVDINSNTVQTPGSVQSALTWVDSGNASFVRWWNNSYYSARTDGKWFSVGGTYVNLAAWNAAVGEIGAQTVLTPLNNASVTFQEAVLGVGGAYDAAFARLRDQTPWNWQENLETSQLIAYVRGRLGVFDADLALSITDTPDPVLQDDTVTYTITTTNNGPRPASGVTVTGTLATCNLGNIASGTSASCTRTVTASAAGTLNQTMMAASSVGIDPNTSNNTASATTNVQGLLTVMKNGTGTGTIISNPAGINCGSGCTEPYDVNTPVTLAAVADGSSVFGTWSGCDTTAGNSCTVSINNNRSVTATFTGLPDLVVNAVSGPGSGTTGASVTINTTTANNGIGTATASVTGLYLSLDATITASDIRLGGHSISSLAPGTPSTGSTSVILPTGLVTGPYYLGAIADDTGQVTEGNNTGTGEDNNAGTGNTLQISGVPKAPGNLTATVNSKSKITLSWTDNATDESGFRIERSTNGTSFSQIASVGTNVKSYANSGLSRNTLYYYRVRAYNSRGNSAYSNTVSARTNP